MPLDVFSAPTLQTEQLSKSYGPVVAAQHVDLRLEAGQTLALLGPSGSGKSTVLRMVAGLETPTAGRVLLRGQDATRWPPEAREVGLVFQDYALFPHLRVLDNVAYGPRRRRLPQPEQLARQMLSKVGLAGLEKRRIHELSGGQQQRVALARALVSSPALLLLDEPLSNLDEQLRASLRSGLRELFQQLGTATLLVTHDQREAAALADTVAIMRGGRVVQQGPAAEVLNVPATAWTAAFLGYSNIFALPEARALVVPEQAILLGVGERYPILQQQAAEGGTTLVSVTHSLGNLQLHLSPRERLNISAEELALSVEMSRCLQVVDDR